MTAYSQIVEPSSSTRRPATLFGLVGSAAAFCYVLSVYLFVTLEGLSRVSIVSAALLLAAAVAGGLQMGRLRVPRALVFPWMFCVFNLFSLLWSQNESVAFETTMQTFSAILGGTALAIALENDLSWRTLAWSAVVAAVLLMISARGEVVEEGISGRAAGLTGNANTLALCLFFAAFFVWCSPARLPGWLNWFVLSFGVYAMLFTGSRKCLIMLVAAVVLAAIRFMPPKWRDRKAWILMGVLVVAAVLLPALWAVGPRGSGIWGVLGETQTFARAEETLNRDRPEIRQQLVETAIELWSTSPVVGHGAGQYALLSGFGHYAHNNFVELLATFGLVGFVLYYSLHVWIVAYALPGALRGCQRQQAAIVLLFLILALDVTMVSSVSKLSWIFMAAVIRLATAGDSGPAPVAAVARNLVLSPR